MAKKPQKKAKKAEKKLKIEQHPLEDLPVEGKEQEDVKGGRAAPYSIRNMN